MYIVTLDKYVPLNLYIKKYCSLKENEIPIQNENSFSVAKEKCIDFSEKNNDIKEIKKLNG